MPSAPNKKRDGDTDRQEGRDSFDSTSNAQRSAETPNRDDDLRPPGQRRQETRPSVDRTEADPKERPKGE
jgi:hypothetical protein